MDRTKSTRKRILSKEKFPDRFFGKYPLTFDSVFPARSRFTTFWHKKVAPKVSAGRKSRGTAAGLRPRFSRRSRRPVFVPLFRNAESVVRL
ncbi:hypothetical protein, partial [Alistipes communis]|uniref:hypothetical protein n=1 Tax=Alistipes communis TaxID=2585118 RepID=UPI003FD77D5E